MRRNIEKYLLKWKNVRKRKPILMRGARQVGKSWLVQNLGKTFPYFLEINFEENPQLKDIFSGSLDPAITVPLLSNLTGIEIIPGETLVFLDEIQACPNAIIALRYFYEKAPDLHIIAAGSLIEFELENVSTPVGRIEFLYIYPLSFSEYMTAIGKEKMYAWVKDHDIHTPVPEVMHQELLAHVRDYVLIGGMPEVVGEFINTKNLEKCQNILASIINTLISDFKKYSKKHELKYLNIVFKALPLQIGRKLKYSNINRELRSREIISAMNLLEKAGLVYKIYHSDSNGIPLEAQVDIKKFKILFFDIGLTNQLLGIDLKEYILNPDITQINNGVIAEAFTGLEIKKCQPFLSDYQLHYWHREKKTSNAEIDYVLVKENSIIPIEVKSGVTGHLRSLLLFLRDKGIDKGVKISCGNFSFNNNIQSIPFYAIEKLIK